MNRTRVLPHTFLPAHRHRTRVLRLIACMAATSAAALPAIAQTTPAFADITDVAHTIQPGDTLEALALHYFGDRRAWPTVSALNRVRDPRHLQPGAVLRIPSHLLPQELATVAYAQGPVAVSPADGRGRPAPVMPGDRLPEGTRLQVGDDAFISLRLADGTVVRVRASSDVQLQQLRRRGRAGSVQSVLDVRAGGVESSVTPLPEPDRRFDIRTPMATTSVRGTRFSVELTAAGQTTASVDEGSVAVGAPSSVGAAHPTLLAPGEGLAVAADGTVGAARALLAAPDITALPASLHDVATLALTVPPVPGALGYQVQIAQDADFTQVVRSGRFDSPVFRLAGLPDARYFLSVRAVDDAGIAGRAARGTVTVKTQPEPPLYQSPAPRATVSRTQGELRCTEVNGARFYRIQLATDAAFSQPLIDEARLTDCRIGVAQAPPGAYFWRAASVRQLPDGGLDEGPFARPQAVTVGESPRPLDAAALQSSDDTDEPGARLYWSAEPGQTFRLQVSATEDFTRPLVDATLAEPAWASADLPPGTYQVRIQTLDASGLQSDFSAPRRFRMGAAIQSGSGLPITASDGQPLTRP